MWINLAMLLAGVLLLLVDRLFAAADDLPPLPADLNLKFPACTTRAQLKRFFALSEALPGPAGADTLERARAAGDPEARLGPLAIRCGPNDDVVLVIRAEQEGSH